MDQSTSTVIRRRIALRVSAVGICADDIRGGKESNNGSELIAYRSKIRSRGKYR